MDRVVVALAQGKGDHFADRGFVIDDQDAFLHVPTVLLIRSGLSSVDYGFMTGL